MNILDTFTELLSDTISIINSIDYSAVMIILMIAIMIALIWNLKKSNTSHFKFEDLFLDELQKASTSKVAVLVALIISSWAFVHLTLNDNLSEWYMAGFMGVWVMNKGLSRWL